MLLQSFRGTNRAVILLIFIAALGVWISAFLAPQHSLFKYDVNPMPLYGFLLKILDTNSFFGILVPFILLLAGAGLLISFNTSVFFINERTFLPAMFFILLIGIFPEYQINNPAVPASLFLIVALRRITDGYKKEGTAFEFFDAALLIGTGSLFYANLIWYGLLVFFGIAIFRTVNLKEIIISLIGLCTPFLITVGVYYVTGNDLVSLFYSAEYNLSGSPSNYYFNRLTLAAIIIFGAVTIYSILYLYSVMGTKKIKSRKTFTLLLWTLYITIIVYFIDNSVSVEISWLSAVPVSFILTHYFIFSKKKIINELMFAAFCLLIVLIQVWYIKS
jgi:hypothetical protein